jgi:hypothetical protein
MWPHVCSLLSEGKLAPCAWNVTNELYYLASSNQSKTLDSKAPETLPECFVLSFNFGLYYFFDIDKWTGLFLPLSFFILLLLFLQLCYTFFTSLCYFLLAAVFHVLIFFVFVSCCIPFIHNASKIWTAILLCYSPSKEHITHLNLRNPVPQFSHYYCSWKFFCN